MKTTGYSHTETVTDTTSKTRVSSYMDTVSNRFYDDIILIIIGKKDAIKHEINALCSHVHTQRLIHKATPIEARKFDKNVRPKGTHTHRKFYR